MPHLHSIRLRGFKTFARPTELIFEPGVTVIIGPNGSGKSNIADAVLWVLGEQSPGNLRGRTMQDVIFSGPNGHKSSAVAEVSLIFDNACGSLPLATSHVEVTRRLVRDGGSEYLLNGVGCRLLDVHDLVGNLGLGREMHSVIGQGKVEAFLNSSPDARRALVEEAAGLGRFKKRRERAQAKLERTKQNLIRVNDIEREVRATLKPLRQQVAAAEQFAKAAEGLALAKAKWTVLALVDSQRRCRETDEEFNRLDLRRKLVEAALSGLRRERAAEEDRFAAALRHREEINAGYHRARSAAEHLEGRAVAVRQRVARIEGELDRAQRRHEMARSELASLSSRVEEVNVRTIDETRLGWVGARLQVLREELERTLPRYKTLAGAEDELKDQVFELEAGRSRGIQDRDFLRREIEHKSHVEVELNAQVEAASTRLEQLRFEAADLERHQLEAEGEVRAAEEALRVAATHREQARAHLTHVSREEMSLGEQIAGLSARREVLQDVLERREGVSAGSRQARATIPGCRLLTEVLSVEPGYERAVAAALGPVAQAVVMPGPLDIGPALGMEGAFEAVWENVEPSSTWSTTHPPEGTRDLWDFVSGPPAVISSLRNLIPPTAVAAEEMSLDDEHLDWRSRGWRLVTHSGELADRGLHAARRRDVGTETLLRARNELDSVVAEHELLVVRRETVRDSIVQAADAADGAGAEFRLREQDVREAERKAAAQKNESELCRRRIDEAETQRTELLQRYDRERGVREQLTADLSSVEQTLLSREAELEGMRASLRDLQAELEALRVSVAELEEKKGQATLIEVRLRERCRAHESERARTLARRQAAEIELARCGRRVGFLRRYVPALTELRSTVERLAGTARSRVARLGRYVEETRAHSENTARTLRDHGGAEAELQGEHDGMAVRLTELRVDQARLADRLSTLEGELAELRRRHMSPRSVTPAEVEGEDADRLMAAVERAERRCEKIGPINPLAEQEYAEVEERARFLAEQRNDLEASLGQLQEVVSGLDEHIERAFSEIFELTSKNFSSVIATVFPGAKGSLKLTEARAAGRKLAAPSSGAEEDEARNADIPGEEAPGIGLEVKLPNKAPRSMGLLSGGEKAMTAIAFLFSLFLARPCPFYILDEVEASLDDLNMGRFLSLVRRYRDRTQFVIITHQRQTMEVADTLYGVALESDGTSRVLSRRLGEKGHTQTKPKPSETLASIPKGA